MNLRLAQWPGAQGGTDGQLLTPGQLLQALGDSDELEWTIADGHEEVEFSGGESTGYIDAMGWYRKRQRVTTAQLLAALTKGHGLQLIWGELRGYPRGATQPIVTISAFDSTWYDIEGNDDSIARLETAFGWARYQE